VATKKINEVIIAESNTSKKELWEIIEYCQLADVEFKVIPAPQKPDYLRNYLDQVREIRLEDLIGRRPVTCDLVQIQKHIQGRRVLITGAGGSIGSELTRQVAGFNPEELILLDRAENSLFYVGLELSRTFPTLSFRQVVADVMNKSLIEKILCQYQPNLIFHAAAHKHVPLMELNPAEAIKNNVLGTRNIARAAIKNGVAEFVLISTDKAVKPISFMGASKRIAEQYVQALAGPDHTKFISVRFGNVLGSSGSVVRLFKEQLEKDGTLTVSHPEATRYFMSISEAVLLILQATLFGKGGEIFILDMGDPVNIYNIAKTMVSLSKKKVGDNYKILFTGLRPGDKLHEELHAEEEVCLPTPHEKIMAINGGDKLNLAQLDHDLDELERQVDGMDRYAMAARMRAIIPSFKPMPYSTQNHRSDSASNVRKPNG
jgi:FlaA1/EpsC-like NDP-sugar epimerase